MSLLSDVSSLYQVDTRLARTSVVQLRRNAVQDVTTANGKVQQTIEDNPKPQQQQCHLP